MATMPIMMTFCAGSITAYNRNAAASSVWNSRIQPRRRPNNGSVKRSSAGAHRNFNVYGNCTQVKMAIALIVNP